MTKIKVLEWCGVVAGVVAAVVAIIGLILYVNELNKKNTDLLNRVHNLELERENLLLIRGKYLDLIVNLATGGKISIKDISPFLPSREVEKVSERLASSSLSFPVNIDIYFYPSGWMGDGKFGEKYIRFVRLEEYIKITYTPGPEKWAGIYWQFPDGNWGRQPGRNLIGAKRLVFKAKGETGKETVEFKTGGIRGLRYEDSFEKSLGRTRLSKDWQRYEIDLTDQSLSNVIGPFAWVASKDLNPEGLTFYLKDIWFEK